MERKKYSRLAPLTLEERIKIALAALFFFGPINYPKVCEAVGKTPVAGAIHPMATRDFVKYLDVKGVLQDAGRYQQRIRGLLDRLVATDVLTKVGHSGDPLLGGQYYFMKEMTKRQASGLLWLAAPLGADLLYTEFSKVTVQITGENRDGDRRAGTGLLVTPTFILTCAHVLEDMKVDDDQKVQNQTCTIVRTSSHPKIDVAVIELDRPFAILPDLHFREPSVSEAAYVVGFPQIPFTQSASLVVHRGEVTSPFVTTLDWADVFLFSAVARPGNSGGPVVSESGAVLGLVTRDLVNEAHDRVIPFYAGVPSSRIEAAIADIAPDLSLPTENYQ